MRKFGKQLLAGPYLVWIIGFIILPVFAVLYYALTNSAGSFTMENIAAIAEPVHLKALFLALKLAVICTLICLLLSYPLAMILNNMKIKEHSFVVFLFVLPMWMNFMLRILAWQMLLSNNGIINSLLKTLGFSGINLMNTPTAVVFGMVYDYLPFMILPIYTMPAASLTVSVIKSLTAMSNRRSITHRDMKPIRSVSVMIGEN